MNTITKKEYPSLFEDILEFEIAESYRQHRRGSNFFVRNVIELTPDDAKHFPDIQDFTPLVGTWETNVFVTDAEYGADLRDINTLTRVYQKEKVITTKTWEPVYDRE